MNKKLFSFIFSVLFVSGCLFAENPLLLSGSDLRLVTEFDKKSSTVTGYHLYIRKNPGLESVMITESSKDPEGKKDNYALRALEYNPINGDEIRFLNGKKLESKYSKYSLIDSTAEKDSYFGNSFHIYIPKKVVFGYPWARSGTMEIKNGSFINIRAFGKKYADYAGGFYDNPFVLDLSGLKDEKVLLPQDESDSENENLLSEEENSEEIEEKSAYNGSDAKSVVEKAEQTSIIVLSEEGNAFKEEEKKSDLNENSDSENDEAEESGWISDESEKERENTEAEQKTVEKESESSDGEKKTEDENNSENEEDELLVSEITRDLDEDETNSETERPDAGETESTDSAEVKEIKDSEKENDQKAVEIEDEKKDESNGDAIALEVPEVEFKDFDGASEESNEENDSFIDEIEVKDVSELEDEVKDSEESSSENEDAEDSEKPEAEKSSEELESAESDGENGDAGEEAASEEREKTPEEIEEEKRAIEEAARKEFLKDFNLAAAEKYTEFSDDIIYTKGSQTLIQDILKCIDTPDAGKESFDLVFVIDATGSMKDEVDELKVGLAAYLSKFRNRFKNFRVGLIYYRDYGDDYSYYGLPIKFFNFTDDMDKFNSNLNNCVITGGEGGDIPDAVYEGLYGGLALFTWNMDAYKKIVFIGDSEPHPKARMSKRYTKQLILKLANDKGVHINSIITPDGRSHERELEEIERVKALEESEKAAAEAKTESDEGTESETEAESSESSESEAEENDAVPEEDAK